MSCVPCDGDGDETCANCGKLGSDTVKLKTCTACRLVKYCGVDCQRAHRKQHKKACKQRAAELKDERLYSQGHVRPEGHFCPICTLLIPLPMDSHSLLMACCMKRVCKGCVMAFENCGMTDCPFCRTPKPGNDAEILAMVQARVAKKDPAAINNLGQNYFQGMLGLQKDTRKAVELWTEAAELGSIEALCNLGVVYNDGEGVQQDKAKAVEFYEKAAMQGHVMSRCKLGAIEAKERNWDRAVRHWTISAKMGDFDSVDLIKAAFEAGLATKEQYADALKGYHDAVKDMKNWNKKGLHRFDPICHATNQHKYRKLLLVEWLRKRMNGEMTCTAALINTLLKGNAILQIGTTKIRTKTMIGKWEGDEWEGMEPARVIDDLELGLLLDLDAGTLSVFKDGRKLGLMKKGLAGTYCWFIYQCLDPYHLGGAMDPHQGSGLGRGPERHKLTPHRSEAEVAKIRISRGHRWLSGHDPIRIHVIGHSRGVAGSSKGDCGRARVHDGRLGTSRRCGGSDLSLG
ncbi:hypothetical protein THAOC_28429 [Thalassiosira oceanica]|uniref:MYND-type domain-containing protein n=1 Tax=Thalassiosira oceanica TaxID=159749 RepID=K0RTU9_THAOC|nr:hypothetical protein THAOC_28429 [Thalassiosira oceanica]|eukprot:EJK52311.1 hypothetical protein THAOC_28429 [Thalassiosira oceanica]